MQIERPTETVKNVTVKVLESHIKNNKGKPIEVTIVNVVQTSIMDNGTRQEKEMYALYFGEIDERLLLNHTNLTTMVDVMGTESDNWEDKKIILQVGTYKDNMGGMGKGVRVKA